MPMLLTDDIKRDLDDAWTVQLRADRSKAAVRWAFAVAPQAGEADWNAGKTLADNPYARGTIYWALWLRAWWNAERGQDS
jgi:hypothetical protein